MTPSERQRRIGAAVDALLADSGLPRFGGYRSAIKRRQQLAFDAADEAVPVVPATWDGLLEHLDAVYPAEVFTGASGDVGARLVVLARKLAEAEAAARDFAAELRRLVPHDPLRKSPDQVSAAEVLARHPSFSGEEETEG